MYIMYIYVCYIIYCPFYVYRVHVNFTLQYNGGNKDTYIVSMFIVLVRFCHPSSLVVVHI